MSENHHLFNEFGPVSSKQWKQQIQFELKGADYNQTLVWDSPEDIKVKPFYHRDEFTAGQPGKLQNGFLICQGIFVHDVEKSVQRALDTLSRGAESIRFTIETESTDVVKLLERLPLEAITLYLDLKFLSRDFIKTLNGFLAGKSARVFCHIDPIGQLAREGNWYKSPEKDNFETLSAFTSAFKNLSFISVDATLYQNAGATLVQQIAYALAHANEYFNRVPNIEKPVLIEISVGSNYFFEIAKLRALRQLFALIAKEYGIAAPLHLLVTPTRRNKTLYDYNVNMLRTTTECMSAILGGADSVANLAYDALYHKDNEFGDRIARNQLLVLKHESYFDKVANPADGSYYIEALTSQLAEKALALFKDMEANDGFLKQLGTGTIKRKISESADKEQELFDSGKEILLGTNKYPNKSDRMSEELELFPFVKTKSRKTLIAPIIEKRLAEKAEQQRLESEKPTL